MDHDIRSLIKRSHLKANREQFDLKIFIKKIIPNIAVRKFGQYS